MTAPGEVARGAGSVDLRFHRLERLGKLHVHGVQNSARREAWRAHGAQSARKRRSTSGRDRRPVRERMAPAAPPPRREALAVKPGVRPQ